MLRRAGREAGARLMPFLPRASLKTTEQVARNPCLLVGAFGGEHPPGPLLLGRVYQSGVNRNGQVGQIQIPQLGTCTLITEPLFGYVRTGTLTIKAREPINVKQRRQTIRRALRGWQAWFRTAEGTCNSCKWITCPRLLSTQVPCHLKQ